MSSLSVNSSSGQPQIWAGANGTSGLQGAGGGGRHHHHKSVSDQINQMGSAIDNAVKAGSLTSDQAASLKKELADVTQTLSQNAQASSSASGTSALSSSASQTSQSNSLSQLSDADRKKVLGELQDVRKQLHATFSTQATNASQASSSSSDAMSKLFSQMDSNGNGSIDQNEFSQFLAQNSSSAYGYNPQGNASSAASILTGSNFSITA